ncbi:phage tail sheath subtilisin-like domain-containing protein [Clostridium cochlearium]|uniref:phage tail sheath subtilisin-like domain-containing protein n=1 Tax=Clostridium cochlearium TaxID=1494 RepID=UPI000BBCE81B|nr:phage tail sheath subtilisin-like domain-containing protein [Clostridium cochlearium]
MKSVEINVSLVQKAQNFIELNARKTVAILVKELTTTGVYNVRTSMDVDKLELTKDNKEFIKRGLGQKTIVIADTTIDKALTVAKAQKFNYICHNFGEVDNTKVKEFVIEQVESYKNNIMGVLANCKADNENIINFTTSDIKVGDKTYTAEEYTSRIASVIANIPSTESATYHVLSEIDLVPQLTKEELDTKIGNGELVLIYDGEKVKIARGVTSLTTLTGKTEDMQSIRLVTIGNIMKNDIQKSVADKYVGKLVGSYNNKMNICQEIKGYFGILASQSLVDEDFTVDLNVQAIKLYLQSIGVKTDDMTEEEIRHYNTKRKCFILCKVSLLDSMEDFYINIEA